MHKKRYNPRTVRILQLGSMPPLKLAYYLSIRSYTVRFTADDIDTQKHSYVIASNHVSMLDPQIVCYGLPASISTRLTPYFFMTANKYVDLWWLGPISRVFGCFPAKEHTQLAHGIEYSSHLLKTREGTVVIFPEGRLTPTPRAHPARPGVKHLAQIENVHVIPVRIKKVGSRYDVIVDKPQPMTHLDETQIMEHIYRLSP